MKLVAKLWLLLIKTKGMFRKYEEYTAENAKVGIVQDEGQD